MPGGFGPRFVLEAAFLVLVAFIAYLASFPTLAIVLVMFLAWVLMAAVEWAAAREGMRWPGLLGRRIPAEGDTGELRPPRRRLFARRPPPVPAGDFPPAEEMPAAQHVRVIPRDPDPASQPVLERGSAEPETIAEPLPTPEPALPPAPAGAFDDGSLQPQPLAEPVASKPREPVAPVAPPPAEVSAPVLAAVPPAAPEPEPVLEQPEPSVVVSLPLSTEPRQWNIWDIERLARERAGADVLQDEEWSYLLMYLREYANADGQLPLDFDPLVRESFGELLAAAPHA